MSPKVHDEGRYGASGSQLSMDSTPCDCKGVRPTAGPLKDSVSLGLSVCPERAF